GSCLRHPGTLPGPLGPPPPLTPLGLVSGFFIVTMLGLLAGALTGLSPGLHVNNVAALVLATQAAWTGFLAALVPDVSSEPETIGLLLSCFLLATAGSHAVFDFIPAVFLGAPTEDTALATLPGHRLLLVGQGAQAVALAARGALSPLSSGFVGIPSLIVGLRARPGSIPYQRLEPLRGLSREDARSALRGTIAGASVSWLPGLSGGAAATLASVGTRRTVGPSQFMVVLGAVSTSTALLSVAVLFMIHRARSGAAAAVRELSGDLAPWPSVWATPTSLLLLVTSAVLATAMAAPLAAHLGRAVARRWSSSNPRRIAALSLLAVLILLAIATGPVGLGLAGLAAVVGLVPIALRVRRVHLMASLLVPVLLTYLGPAG